MNIQNEPMFDIASNLAGILLAECPALKSAKIGWPDRKWLQVEKNLPAIFLVDVSERGEHAVSQHAVSSTIRNPDGTGLVVYEKLRLHTLVQLSLFTHTKGDRDQLGWQIKRHFIINYRIPILDYTKATPAPTGEHLMLYFRGDRKELRGEANFYQRDLTFEIQSRVLEGVPANVITKVNVNHNVNG